MNLNHNNSIEITDNNSIEIAVGNLSNFLELAAKISLKPIISINGKDKSNKHIHKLTKKWFDKDLIPRRSKLVKQGIL